VLLTSQVASGLLSLALLILMPIYLGDVGRGRLAFAQSIGAVITTLTTLGLSPYIVREVAADGRRLRELAWASLLVRTPIWILVTVVVLSLLSRRLSAEAFGVVVVIALATLLNVWSDVFDAALRGLERMQRRSVALVANSAVFLVLGLPILAWTRSPLALGAVLFVGSAVALVINASYFRGGRLPFTRPDVASYRALALSAAPFLAMYAAQGLFSQLDTVLLGLLTDEATVGWYAAANALALGIMLVPTVMFTAALPVLSRIAGDREALAATARRLLDMTLLVALPLAVGLAVIAPRLFEFLRYPPTFAHSVPILILQCATVAVSAVVTLFNTLIIGLGRERAWAYAVVGSLGLFLLLNVVLIPVGQALAGNGGVGAAAANLLGEAIMLVVATRLLPGGIPNLHNLGYALRVVLACLAMGLGVLICSRLPLPLTVVLAGLIYACASVLLRTMALSDLRLLSRLVRARSGEHLEEASSPTLS
jgi:O-antigen/teichoic acid export membrane protein